MNFLKLGNYYKNAFKKNLEPIFSDYKLLDVLYKMEDQSKKIFKDTNYIKLILHSQGITLKTFLEEINIAERIGDKIDLSKLFYIGKSFNRAKKIRLKRFEN